MKLGRITNSYLRHIQKCWIVQANWKASDHWEKSISDQELDEMRDIFGSDKSVFKQNDSWQQFQGEIDLMGVLAGDMRLRPQPIIQNGFLKTIPFLAQSDKASETTE